MKDYDPKAVLEYAKRWLDEEDLREFGNAIEAADLFARALVDLAEPVLTVRGDMEPEELKRRLALVEEQRSIYLPIILDFECVTREQAAAAGFEDDSPEYREALATFEEDKSNG